MYVILVSQSHRFQIYLFICSAVMLSMHFCSYSTLVFIYKTSMHNCTSGPCYVSVCTKWGECIPTQAAAVVPVADWSGRVTE